MNKIVKGVAAGLAFLVTGAFAPNAHAAWCYIDVTPKEVLQFKTGEVGLKGPEFSSSTGSVIVCDRDTDGACDNWLSLGEAALLSGRKLRIRVNDYTCGAVIPERPSIAWIMLL